MSQIVGVVLAGGEGRRIGREKGGLLFEGRSLARIAASVLHPLCGTVLMSVGSDNSDPAPGYTRVVDRPPAGRGPLAGIQAAFKASGRANLLVLACDYPRMSQELLRQIVESAVEQDDLVIPTDPAGRDHPLAALWLRSSESVIDHALAEERHKVRALFSELAVHRLGPSELPGVDLARVLTNVNTRKDLEGLSREPRE